MTIVIKEIVVKTTVESEKKESPMEAIPDEWMKQLKDEILREIMGAKMQEIVKRDR